MDLSRISGAVFQDGLLLHCGDPFGEQRRLAQGKSAVLLADHAVIEVAGTERLTWLNSITSQELRFLKPGEGSELLVLDPQGRVEHSAAVLEDGSSTWLIVDRADATALVAWLARMVFRAAVTVASRPDIAVVGFMRGGAAEQAMAPLALTLGGAALIWEDPWSTGSVGGHQYSQAADHPAADYQWSLALLPQDQPWPEVAVSGVLAAEALRIAAWRPRWANEVDERSLPHETDWLRTAVHLNKGCYRGQETVAKVHNLGHPPRRLALLHLDGMGGDLPEPGTEVFAGEKVVGHVTSATRHYEDGPIALALLGRRTSEEEALTMVVEGNTVNAAAMVIVPADAGATAQVPKISRLSRRR